MLHGFRRGILVAAGLCATTAPVYAQGTTRGRWQVDFHAGGTLGGDATGGTAIGEFPAGDPIPTTFGTSRAVSSWYFGDGAQLLNQTNAAFRVGAEIVPLDDVLTSALVERTRSAVFGFRVSRELTPRFAAEFSVDRANSSLQLRDSAASAIESTTASFIAAWNGFFTRVLGNEEVTSTSDVVRGDGSETTVTGAVKVRLRRTSRVSPYLTAGGGSLLRRGTAPSATLTGRYMFPLPLGVIAPIDERDVVTIRVERKKNVPVGLVGGGVEYTVRERHGLRADVRWHVSGNDVDTVVSATPALQMATTAGLIVSTGTVPGIQFSNVRIISLRSSLSGPAISGLRTFEGSGMRVATDITFGFFVRF